MKKNIILIVIIVIGFIFRFYSLGGIPNSLNWDEVSWGYNAYSILNTGRDEHGQVMPLSFKAFGDYKQPIYVYLDVMSIKLFGLNPFSVRFPSAFFGTLSILSFYFLSKEILRKEKHRDTISLVAAFLFAVSPWSIQFSRVAYEANVAIFFIVTGAAAFLSGARKNILMISVIGVILLGISTYSYHSAKVFTPLLSIALTALIVYRYKISKKKCLVLGVIFLLLTSLWVFDSRTTARGRSVTFTSYQTSILKDSIEKVKEDKENGDELWSILHNRRYVYLNVYLQNYLMHFDPNYLFIKGDDARHHAPGMGILYIACLPFILIGLYQVVKKRNEEGIFILFWLLIAPLASALAIDSPNASRSLVMLPAFLLLSASGITTTVETFSMKKKFASYALIAVLYAVNILYYSNNYFGFTNKYHQSYWQYGYKEAIDATRSYTNDRVFFLSDIEQGYMFYLFYEKYDPKKYIARGGLQEVKKSCFVLESRYFGSCESTLRSGDIVITSWTKPNRKTKVLKRITIDENTVIAIKEVL